jgi:catechol 2,3-dioxygenase-like lactoylglutathione lyase family enzyme
MFTEIRCLAVYVTDMERAKKFYTEVLGFEISADVHPNLCFLRSKTGRGKVPIYLEGGHKPASADDDTARLSFFLEPEKRVPEVFEELKRAGVKILQEAPELVSDDIMWFQFCDPDGNILEVSGKP